MKPFQIAMPGDLPVLDDDRTVSTLSSSVAAMYPDRWQRSADSSREEEASAPTPSEARQAPRSSADATHPRRPCLSQLYAKYKQAELKLANECFDEHGFNDDLFQARAHELPTFPGLNLCIASRDLGALYRREMERHQRASI